MQLATIPCEMPQAITHAAHPKRCEDGMWRCNPKNTFFTEVRAPALTDVVSFIFKHIVLKTENLDFLPLYLIYVAYICFNLFAYYCCFKCWKRKKSLKQSLSV